MKRLLLYLLFACITGSAFAISYNEARSKAWFITDKMAYELNLTPEQYTLAYKINLDYLLSVSNSRDYLGVYWDFRDADMRLVLSPWQYKLYSSIDYFFRPLLRRYASWHYPIFAKYKKNYYYFERPEPYFFYNGMHWKKRNKFDKSPYRPVGPMVHGHGMRDNYKPIPNHRPNQPGKPNKPNNNLKPNKPNNNFKPQTPNRPGRPNGNYGNGQNKDNRPSMNRQPNTPKKEVQKGNNSKGGNERNKAAGSSSRSSNNKSSQSSGRVMR